MNFRTIVAGALVATMMSANVFAASDIAKEIKSEDTQATQVGDVKKTNILTYNEAVQLAIKNNSTLSSLALNQDMLEEKKEMAYQYVSYSPNPSGEYVSIGAEERAVLVGLDALDTGIKSSRYTKQMLEESCELVVKTYFMNIKNDEASLKLLQENYKIEQQNLINAQTKQRLGMISQKEVDSIASNLENASANLKMIELKIESEYASLNSLLGLSADLKFEIDYNLEFEKYNFNTSIDSYISRKVSSDPYLKSLELASDSAKFNLNTSAYNVAETYKEREVKYNDASRKEADSVRDMRVAIKEGYNNLVQLEASIKSLEKALETAKANVETAKVNLEIGNITNLEYDMAKMAVINAENELQRTIYTYDMAKFTFEHPYVYLTQGEAK